MGTSQYIPYRRETSFPDRIRNNHQRLWLQEYVLLLPKVIVRNTNSDIEFENEDSRLMTSRAKSRLDVLANLVTSRNVGGKQHVIKAWTDEVDINNLMSLHYEGTELCPVWSVLITPLLH